MLIFLKWIQCKFNTAFYSREVQKKPKIKIMKTKFLFPLIVFVFYPFVWSVAQQTAATAGDNIQGTDGSVSYTVGQVASLYLGQSGGSVAHKAYSNSKRIFWLLGL
jgi:uncharacterized protein (UPF0333 family)